MLQEFPDRSPLRVTVQPEQLTTYCLEGIFALAITLFSFSTGLTALMVQINGDLFLSVSYYDISSCIGRGRRVRIAL